MMHVPHISALWLLAAFGVGVVIGPIPWYYFKKWFFGADGGY